MRHCRAAWLLVAAGRVPEDLAPGPTGHSHEGRSHLRVREPINEIALDTLGAYRIAVDGRAPDVIHHRAHHPVQFRQVIQGAPVCNDVAVSCMVF